MKNILRLIGLIFIINACIATKNSNEPSDENTEQIRKPEPEHFAENNEQSSASETQYFDNKNKQISKSEFDRKLNTRVYLQIPGDSINHQRLIFREETGQVRNLNELFDLIERSTNQKLDQSKPLVAIYYPGKDECNSSGMATRNSITVWYNQLEKRLKQIAKVKPIYIYKSKEGLERFGGIMTWHKDPENIFEQLFFEHIL